MIRHVHPHLRRNVALQLFLVLSCVVCGVARSEYRVIGYYPMWMRSSLPAGNVRFNYLTHIMHAFAWPNADGSLAFGETNVDTALINATHRAGRRILLSFGGAGATQTANFAIVAADTVLRRRFIGNIVSHLTMYHYDGADMDWEGPSSAADRANETAMVEELRSAFRAADTTLLLTMAVGPTDWSGQWHDFAILMQYVDWFTAMTYDFHGSWSAHSGHNAPLYAPPLDPDGSADLGIRYLHQTRGIPGGQLSLGLPFYGKRFLNTSGLYMPFSGETDILYADVQQNLVNGWTFTWDTLSRVPYLMNPTGTQLDTFDDTTSLVIKCAYAKANGLSGVSIWALGEDLWNGGQPLMDAVGTAMSATVFVSPQPEPALTTGYILFDAYPNPFNPTSTIRYRIPQRSVVTLGVYNSLGQEVSLLVRSIQDAGYYAVKFEAMNLASGMYFYCMRVGDFVQTKRLLLLK